MLFKSIIAITKEKIRDKKIKLPSIKVFSFIANINKRPPVISYRIYENGIFFWQNLHLVFKFMYEKIGIRSLFNILLLQNEQWLGG